MKISKLLNKNFFFNYINFFLCFSVNAEEQPVDIWNIDKENK